MPRLTEARYEENFPGANFSDEEIAFLKAIEEYRRLRKRLFPTWCEVLRVLKALGYRKVAEPSAIEPRTSDAKGRRRS